MIGSIKFAPLILNQSPPGLMRTFPRLAPVTCFYFEPSLVHWTVCVCFDWPLCLLSFWVYDTQSVKTALAPLTGYCVRPLTIQLVIVPACRCKFLLAESLLKLNRASYRGRTQCFYGRNWPARNHLQGGSAKLRVFHRALLFLIYKLSRSRQ